MLCPQHDLKICCVTVPGINFVDLIEERSSTKLALKMAGGGVSIAIISIIICVIVYVMKFRSKKTLSRMHITIMNCDISTHLYKRNADGEQSMSEYNIYIVLPLVSLL